jgi:transposase-like protein
METVGQNSVEINTMMGFKSFWAARRILAGVETMHMIRKGQIICPTGSLMPAAQQFYSLAI